MGTGIDIIEIDRIRTAIQRHDSFVDRFFAPEERAYFRLRKMNICTIAGGFAAKEAVVKAMGTGFGYFGWREVIITRDCEGRPVAGFKGRAKQVCQERGIDQILVCISHSRDYAVAQAIALGGEKECGL